MLQLLYQNEREIGMTKLKLSPHEKLNLLKDELRRAKFDNDRDRIDDLEIQIESMRVEIEDSGGRASNEK